MEPQVGKVADIPPMVSSDRENYDKQFEELFTAFAKVSAIIQSKSARLDRIQIKGFNNENSK